MGLRGRVSGGRLILHTMNEEPKGKPFILLRHGWIFQHGSKLVDLVNDELCVAKLIDGRISIPEQLLRGGRRTDRTASDDAKGTEKEATGTSEGRLRDGTFPIADLEPQSIDDRDHSSVSLRRMVLLVCFVGCEPVTPGGDVLGADGGELLPGTKFDTGMGEELLEVALIRPAGMRGRGAELPRLDGPRHLLAEVGGQHTRECRDGIGPDFVDNR